MKVEIYTDFSCPFCYLGKKRLEEAIQILKDDIQIELSYRSFILNPNAPLVQNMDSYTYFSKLKGIPLNQVKDIFLQTKEQAKKYNLNFNYDVMKMTATTYAHLIIKSIKEPRMQKEISNLFFKAYFEEGYNLSDLDDLATILKPFDLNRYKIEEIIQHHVTQELLQEDISLAEAYGIESVPFIIVNDQYAIKGAQPTQVFKQYLEQIYNNITEEQHLGNDSCSI